MKFEVALQKAKKIDPMAALYQHAKTLFMITLFGIGYSSDKNFEDCFKQFKDRKKN